MKRFILLVLASLVFFAINSSLLYGQDFYLTGGINVSKLGQTKDMTFSSERIMKPGFQIGSMIGIKLNDRLSVMPGLQFSMKQESYESSWFSSPYEEDHPYEVSFKGKAKNYYLDLPVFLKLSYSLGNSDIFGIAGPYVSYRLSENGNSEFYKNGEPYQPNYPETEESELNKVDYGINIGIGLEINRYLMQMSYDYGFYHNLKYKNEWAENSITIRNSALRLSLGYKF